MSAQPKQENVNLTEALSKAETAFDEGVALCLFGASGVPDSLFVRMLNSGMKRVEGDDKTGDRLVYDPDAAERACHDHYRAIARQKADNFAKCDAILRKMAEQGTNYTYKLGRRPYRLFDVVDDRCVNAVERLNRIAASKGISKETLLGKTAS